MSEKHSNDTRVILHSDWYRRLFPGACIGLTGRGFRLATSVGGVLTGRAGDIVVIDDPIKPGDALSEPMRNEANHWFVNTLLSRLDNKQTGAIVLVMQRLHMDDLTGFVLRQGGDDWTVLTLPAIAEVAETIQLTHGRAHRRRIGDVQRMGVIQSWDTAMKGGPDNDWSVCTTWLRCKDQRWYLLDVWRGRVDYPGLKAQVAASAKTWHPHQVLVEESGTAVGLLQELRYEVAGLTGIRQERDKLSRMSMTSSLFEAGQVFLPEQASWLPELETELFSFPGGRHDDQVDSISQALLHAKNGAVIWAMLAN